MLLSMIVAQHTTDLVWYLNNFLAKILPVYWSQPTGISFDISVRKNAVRRGRHMITKNLFVPHMPNFVIQYGATLYRVLFV